MRTVTRFGALALLFVVAMAGWSLSTLARGAVKIGSRVEVTGAAPKQLELVRWAIGRFETAGLEAPAVEVGFHEDRVGCGGHLGLATEGRVEICTTLVNAMTRRVLLHELSHAWLDQNLIPSVRARFLGLRGLASWNASSVPWRLRGYEQGAEIISWAIGERILTAQVPDNEPSELQSTFELLTG